MRSRAETIPVTRPPCFVTPLSHSNVIIIIKTVLKYPYQNPFIRLCLRRDVDIIISSILSLCLSIFIIRNHSATFYVSVKRWYFILIANHWHAEYFLLKRKNWTVILMTPLQIQCYCTQYRNYLKYFIILI